MKKGFTLIELLAVIAILAIIALIATPIILGIIEDARKGSIEASANGYIDAVEYKIARDEIKGSETSSGIYEVSELDIDIDGEKPTSGTIIINKGNVVDATLVINDKTVYYDGNVAKVIDLYKEELLNGADPVLKGELIPVTLSSDGKVIKADTSKEWYNYENKEWANAVILFDEKSYKVGEEIKEESIKEYYVWIPRYSYRLWNVNSDNTENVGKPIEIVFGDKAKTTGENNGDMYVHPAFTNFNTKGIWVGKFETSYNEETFTDSSTFLSVTPKAYLGTDSKELIIKPNVRTLTNKSIAEFHTLIYNSRRNLNSHVITNMEWGAIAYLTYSVYGRCDDETCTEVTNNNAHTGWYGGTKLFEEQWEYGSNITGCAADNIGDSVNSIESFEGINRYNSKKGVLASTTGNITGIYDMSGGNWEYVMGALVQPDGKVFSGRCSNDNSNLEFKGIYGVPAYGGNTSGLTENDFGIDLPDSKYYNTYKNNYDLGTSYLYDYSEGKLGDATKEVANTKGTSSNVNKGNWFDSYARFVTTYNPWFGRGGSNDGVDTGIMSFNSFSPVRSTNGTTRAVLAF